MVTAEMMMMLIMDMKEEREKVTVEVEHELKKSPIHGSVLSGSGLKPTRRTKRNR